MLVWRRRLRGGCVKFVPTASHLVEGGQPALPASRSASGGCRLRFLCVLCGAVWVCVECVVVILSS